ncbi:hypothetical protein CGRA01v4_07841 [Colletotrichum graminicola]|nr:hypothetical protein CGRA01v4_07841 [Colletotrichum graminicola]
MGIALYSAHTHQNSILPGKNIISLFCPYNRSQPLSLTEGCDSHRPQSTAARNTHFDAGQRATRTNHGGKENGDGASQEGRRCAVHPVCRFPINLR